MDDKETMQTREILFDAVKKCDNECKAGKFNIGKNIYCPCAGYVGNQKNTPFNVFL